MASADADSCAACFALLATCREPVAEKHGGSESDEAQAACTAREECAGLTFRKPAAVATCDAAQAGAVVVTAYLKLSSSGNSDPEWCTVAPPARLVGVFVENVESLHSAELKE